MVIARISAYKRLKKQCPTVLMVNTVHDDLELDSPNDSDTILLAGKIMEKVFEDIPSNFKRLYGIDLNIPFSGDVSVGQNLKNMISLQKYVDNGCKL